MLNVVIVKYYGVAGFGIYTLAFSWFMFLQLVAVAGVDQSVVKLCSEIVENREAQSAIIFSGLAVVVVAGLLCLAASWFWGPLFAGILFKEANPFTVLHFLLPALPFVVVNKILAGVLNAHRRMMAYSTVQVLRPLLIVLGVLTAALTQRPLQIAVISFIATEVVLLSALLIMNGRYLTCFPRITTDCLKKHISFGYYELLNQVFSDLNLKADYFLLGIFTGPAVVGAFAFAADLIKNATLLAIVIQINFNPIVAGLWAQDKKEELRQQTLIIMRNTYKIYGPLLIIGVLIYPIFTKWAVPAVFSLENQACFIILSAGVFIWAGAIAALGILSFTYLVRWQARRAFLTLVINVAGNFLLVPWLGALGAAVATAVSFAFSAMLVWWIVERELGMNLRPWHRWGRMERP